MSPRESSELQERKPYSPPALVCYGNVRDLTLGDAGTEDDQPISASRSA